MDKIEQKRFFYSGFFPLVFVLILWVIKTIEVNANLDFSSYGILPRTQEGILGIFLSPFIHGGWTHLINNSIPLLILGWAVFYFYNSIAVRVIVLSYLLAGLYTWISARTSYHIGASGIVYSMFGFLFISGFIRKYIPLIALSFLVAFLYGSLIWGILPWDKTMSWEGHFWGIFVGLILAVFYRKQGPQKKEFVWEEEEEEAEETKLGDYVEFEEIKPKQEQEVIYHFVPKEDRKED